MQVGDLVTIDGRKSIGIIVGFTHGWVKVAYGTSVFWEQPHFVKVLDEDR